jgi:hypothetical protein
MARLVCPYCFEKVRRRDLLFRCVGGGPGRLAGCPPTLDEPYQRYLRAGAAGSVLPPVFAADGRKPRAVHDACGQVSLRRVCPHCHNELAGDYCDVPSRLVALVGAKNAGKSTYIAVLIRQLLNQVGKELQASLMACDDRTGRRYREDFERPLYERAELLPVTQSAASELHEPLVYRLTLTRRWWRLPRRRALTLVLFDTAGEDLTSNDSVDQHLRYLGVADAVVFLVDPLELPGAQSDVRVPDRAGAVAAAADDPLDVIRRVTSLLRAAHERPSPKRLPLPVAVALTKVDALADRVAAQSQLHLPRPRTGRLDLADRGLVDEQVRALLEQWGAGAIDRELANSYRAHGLFGLSALGHPPSSGAVDPTGISPHRVEDPLLWLLHRFRMISATRPGGTGEG